MKKLFTAMLFTLLLGCCQTGFASEVSVEPSTMTIDVNHYNLSSAMEWPPIVYKDIVYLPLDQSVLNVLSFEREADDNGVLYIHKRENPLEYAKCAYLWTREIPEKVSYTMGSGLQPNPDYIPPEELPDISSDKAYVYESPVYINGVLSESEEYPFLVYAEMLYMPLDWTKVEQLGVKFSYDPESGIKVRCDSRYFSLVKDPSRVSNENIVSGDIRISTLILDAYRWVQPIMEPYANCLFIQKGEAEMVKPAIDSGDKWYFGYKKAADAADEISEPCVEENLPGRYIKCREYIYSPEIEIDGGYLYINACRNGWQNCRCKVNLDTLELEYWPK